MKFKIGDRVKFSKHIVSDMSYYLNGATSGEIIKLHENSGKPYYSGYNEKINGHDGAGSVSFGHCWNFYEEELDGYDEDYLLDKKLKGL